MVHSLGVQRRRSRRRWFQRRKVKVSKGKESLLLPLFISLGPGEKSLFLNIVNRRISVILIVYCCGRNLGWQRTMVKFPKKSY